MVLKNKHVRGWKMAQWIRAQASLPRKPEFKSHTHIKAGCDLTLSGAEI